MSRRLFPDTLLGVRRIISAPHTHEGTEMNLRGATALVTGGSNGIGLAIAKTLTEAGAKVAIRAARKRLAAAGKATAPIPYTPTWHRRRTSSGAIKELFQTFDHLDILVNNAGFGVLKPLVEMDLASFEQVFATNVTGAMLMAREAAKHFVERRAATSSTSVRRRPFAARRRAPHTTAASLRCAG